MPRLGTVLCAGAALLSAATLATQSAALPDARWRCKMNGDIPLGTLTVSGSSYQFVVAKNSLWEPKPGDSGNGSGAFTESGDSIVPTSGPLATVYKVVGRTVRANDGSYVLYFSDKSAGFALFGCWPG
jgi:hypothetical protein